MDRTPLFFLVLALCVLNGMFSAPLLVLFFQATAASFAFATVSPSVLLYLSSLFGATLTLVVSGLPVAVFERITGREDSDVVSLMIWLALAFLLSLPALQRILELLA